MANAPIPVDTCSFASNPNPYVFPYFGASHIRSAAEVATPPITHGMPNSTWPATAAAMQPIASAPSPTCAQSEMSRFVARPLALELVDRGERLVAQLAGLDRLGRLDHLGEHRLHGVGLRLRRRPFHASPADPDCAPS